MAPLFSVLIPTHNRPDVLSFAIRSALAQTLADFELLVVGDGCTDNTAQVVHGFSDPRLTWLDYPKAPGFGYANRNSALRQARGEYVAYLAHDDLWFPDHLERMAACLAQSGAEWAFSQPLEVSTSGQVMPLPLDLHDPATRAAWRAQHIGRVSTTNVVHRRACLEAYGYWNERLSRGGDWELWMRILDGGQWASFAFHPAPTGMHFVADWRRGTTTWQRKMWHRLRAWEGFSPPEFSLPVPPGMAEQDAAWRAISAAPEAWAAGLRRAVQADLDRRRLSLAPSNLLERAHTAFQRATKPRARWHTLP
jgi:glycosyltransferase involved in cell wall biosynthesis